MKKLMSLLGAIMLTTSTVTAIVACKHKSISDGPEVEELVEMVTSEDFKNEIRSINNKIVGLNENKFTQFFKGVNNKLDNTYDFFDYNKLINNYKLDKTEDMSQGIKSSNKPILEEDKQLLLNDISKMLSNDAFKSQFNSLEGSGNKFENWYLGKDETLGQEKWRFNDDNIEIVTIQSNENNKKQNIWSVKVSIVRTMFHATSITDRTPVEFNVGANISINVGEDGAILKVLKDIASELPSSLLKGGVTHFKSSSLRQHGKRSLFKPYGDLTSSIQKSINNEEFLDKMNEVVKKINKDGIYNVHLEAKNNEIVKPKSIITDNILFKYKNPSAIYKQSKIWTQPEKNPLLNSLIIKKNDSNLKYLDFEKGMSFLKDNSLKDYKDELNLFQAKLEEDIIKKYKDNSGNVVIDGKGIYTYGTIVIPPLKVNFNENDFILLNLSMPWTYENDIDNWTDSNGNIENPVLDTNDDSNNKKVNDFFKALYFSIIEFNKNFTTRSGNNSQLFNISDDGKKKFIWAEKTDGSGRWTSKEIQQKLQESNDKSLSFDKYVSNDWQKTMKFNINDFFKDNEDFQFESPDFFIQSDGGIEFKIRLTKDGRWGIGFGDQPADVLLNKLTKVRGAGMNFKINIGVTRIQFNPFRRYMGENEYNGAGMNDFVHDSNFFGSGKTYEQFLDEIIKNRENFLLFDLGKIVN